MIFKGYIKAQNFKSDNKLSYMYILTPKGISQKISNTAVFKLKQLEYKEIQKEIIELEKTLNMRYMMISNPMNWLVAQIKPNMLKKLFLI